MFVVCRHLVVKSINMRVALIAANNYRHRCFTVVSAGHFCRPLLLLARDTSTNRTCCRIKQQLEQNSRISASDSTCFARAVYRYTHSGSDNSQSESNSTTSESSAQSEGASEQQLRAILSERFPAASRIDVADISGGCGAMFEVYVEAAEFAGVRLVNQHRAVHAALGQHIADMHGIRVTTAVPDSTKQ